MSSISSETLLSSVSVVDAFSSVNSEPSVDESFSKYSYKKMYQHLYNLPSFSSKVTKTSGTDAAELVPAIGSFGA